MSKMTKTQVTHLQLRLNKALNDKAKELFGAVYQPTSKPFSSADAAKKVGEICKLLGLEDNGDYHVSHIARRILGVIDPKLVEANKIASAKQKEYRDIKQKEIDKILDAAILGDSTEALQALQEFQEAL